LDSRREIIPYVGRIVLCLDSDDAGVAAIERLCTGHKPILVSATENLNVDIYVATLPEGIKDPADFLEQYQGVVDRPDKKFRLDVVQNATEWSVWYMDRLIASPKMESGNKEKQSFSDVFERVASFLATFEKKEDLAKRASLVAPKLANLVTVLNNTETQTMSSTVLSQLESELVEKANDLVRSRSTQFSKVGYDRTKGLWKSEMVISKSLEISDDISLMDGPFRGLTSTDIVRRRSEESESAIPKSLEITEDISLMDGPRIKATPTDMRQRKSEVPELTGTDPSVEAREGYPESSTRRKRTSLKRPVVPNTSRKTMSTHVGGLISNTFDEKWLGVTKDVVCPCIRAFVDDRFCLVLFLDHLPFLTTSCGTKYGKESNHLGYELSIQRTKSEATTKSIGPDTKIRFNTNQYHGAWATVDATVAGYRATKVFPKDSDFLTKGTSSLVQLNEEDMSTFLENVLLRTMVLFPTARNSLGESIRVSHALGSHGTVKWSSPEKAWLFKCLVDRTEEGTMPDDVLELRSFLLTRSDMIPGALIEVPVHEDDLRPTPIEVANEHSQVSTTNTKETIVIVDSIGRDGGSAEDISMHDDHWLDTDEGRVEPIHKSDNTPIPQSSRVAIPEIEDGEWAVSAEMDEFIPSFFVDEDVGKVFEDDVERPDVSSVQDADERLESLPGVSIANSSNSTIPPSIIDPQRIMHGDSSATTAGFLEADFVVSEEPSGGWGVLDHFFVTDDVEELDIFTMPYADIDSQETGSNDVKAGWAVQDLYAMLQFTSALHRVSTARAHILAESSTKLILEGTDIPQSLDSKYDRDTESEDDLRQDLSNIRGLFRGNQRAIERIYSLIAAQFSDTDMLTRGYSWLGKVLEFNQRKMETWTKIVEEKDGFFYSDMRVEELEETVVTEWNELSKDGEMWDWNNVNDNHESFIAGNIRESGLEESYEILGQIETDWEWAIGDEVNDSDDANEWAVEEGDDQIEEEWVSEEERDTKFDDDDDGWADQEHGDQWE
jgi:hypothetical protein